MAANFSSVPILDYALTASPCTKPQFIAELRHALVNVGFLYLSNPPVASQDIEAILNYVPKFFELPQAKKDKICMANSEHFFGYTALGRELTKGRTDQREQFDFGTPHVSRYTPGDPDYRRLWGASQWPEEDALPGFQETMSRYCEQVQDMSYQLIELLAEAFSLPAGALKQFFDSDDLMQHTVKIVKYPDTVGAGAQGVGPHYDAGFLTFLLQASDHPGLQVQNLSGEWIPAPPIHNTFVVNIGKSLEFVTQGVARATSHRVFSPAPGSGPRYSVPFFQSIGLGVRLTDHILQLPQEVLDLKEKRGDPVKTDSVNFSEFDCEPSGQVSLIGRVKSHPDVAQLHYPKLFHQIFPAGLPKQGMAY